MERIALIARSYAYDPAHPHAVRGLTVSGEQTAAYEYDQNGNMACRLEDGLTYKQTYNAENRIAAIQRMDGTDCAAPGQILESWLFTYDGDGLRTGQIHYRGQTAVENSLLFFGGTYEVRQDLAAAASTTKAYYAIGGQAAAMRTVTATESTLSYFLTDHLGSVSAILDETGTLTNQQRYLPFGAVRSDLQGSGFGITQTDRTYTGQRDLSGTGLMDYKARFYSPYLNRFIQPDTLIPGAGDPQAWNRYSYALGNPVTLNDPTGHAAECGIQAGTSCAGVGPRIPTLVKDQNGISLKAKFKEKTIEKEIVDWLVPDSGTVGFGLSGTAGSVVFVTGSISVATIDSHGNVVLFSRSAGGGALLLAAAEVAGFIAITDADNVDQLEGWSMSLGASGEAGASFGYDRVFFADPSTGEKIRGSTVTVGGGLSGLIPAEGHVGLSYTWNGPKFNLYESLGLPKP